MPHTDPEKRKEYKKQYYQKNKEKLKEKNKKYTQENKEKIKQYKKEWSKEYNQTPQGKKKLRIARWKRRGIVPPCSWDEFYDKWEKAIYCDDCGVVMTIDEGNTTSTTKCPDHDHSITDGSPNFRGFVCNACNIRRG